MRPDGRSGRACRGAAQRDVASGEQRRQRLLRRCGWLDPGEAHLAAVVETHATRIDDCGDAAVALGLELARCGERGVTGDERKCDDEMKQSRHGARKGCVVL